MFKKLKRWFNRPRNPSGHLYYARLATPQGTYYKIGFTTKSSLKERMAYGGYGDEKLIDREFIFAYRDDAWDIEQTLLEHFAKHRAFKKYSNDPMMPLNGRGQSELFKHDVLGLDDELYRLSDEQRAALEPATEGCLLVLLGLVLAPFTLGLSLFFITGGVSGIFESNVGGHPVSRRPTHPAKIQELLDTLLTPTKPTTNGEA
jgi:hypothetical protein